MVMSERRLDQVVQQRRLPDAGLAPQHQRPALAAADGVEQVVQRGALVSTPKQASEHVDKPSRIDCVWLAQSGLRHLRIQERLNHVEYQAGPRHAEEMGGARKHCELGRRNPDEVAVDVAAAQLQELDRVLEPDGVAVADRDEGRGGDRPDVGVGPAGKSWLKAPSLSSRSCSRSGCGDFSLYACSIGVPAIMSTVIEPTASLFSGRIPSGLNDADDTISLRTSSGWRIAR